MSIIAFKPAAEQRAKASQITGRGAIITSLVMVTAFLAIVPFAGTKLPPLVPFYIISNTAICMMAALTGFFLMTQYHAEENDYFGSIAGIYYFISVCCFFHLIIFPGVLSAQGALSDGPGAAAWVFIIWHVGVPAMAALALVMSALQTAMPTRLRHSGTICMAAYPVLAMCLCAYAVSHTRFAPDLVQTGHFTPVFGFYAAAIIAVNFVVALAYVFLNTRQQSLLHRWLPVCMLANIGDTLMVLCGPSRFTLGWYTARLFDLVAATILLCVLIKEFTQLYKQMAKANLTLTKRVSFDG